METVYSIVKHLEATPGKNDKLAYLKANANDDIKEFFYLALEPTILFWIKKIPAYTPDTYSHTMSFFEATYELVNVIASRKRTGDAARNFVADLLSQLTENDAKMLERIILKDASVGMSAKTINKVWKGLCTEKLYDRCAAFNEKNLAIIKYRALVQLKADGLFINVIRKSTGTTFLSRNMKPMEFHGYLEEEIAAFNIPGDVDMVIHGEGLVMNKTGTGFEDRKTGNGIISKAIKGTISKEEASRVHLKVWDIMPLADWKAKKCIFPYEQRLRTLEAALPVNSKVKIIATKAVNNLDEAYEFFNKMLDNGQEGCILKNLDGIWRNSSSGNKDCVKMKKKDPADLLCVGTIPFAKKTVMRGSQEIDTSNWIGALILESSDGFIKCNAGSGLNDEMREMPPSHYIGGIFEIEYNEIISSKTKATMSLFLPIIKERRVDKDEADSYELIVERAKGRK
jgi:ATP-dependent DNA ligase